MNRQELNRCRWDRAGQEPPLDDMLADPVMTLMLRRDGLTSDDVLDVMHEARRHRERLEARAVG